MRDTDITERDIIIASDGREIDVTWELKELLQIGRHYYPDEDPSSHDRRVIHRFGWGLIAVAGIEAATDLVDEMEEDEDIGPHFAEHLRTKWTAIAKNFE